jgi:hypothetical protein
MALNLVIAAITFWNTIYMDKAANHLAETNPLYGHVRQRGVILWTA